MLCSVKMTNKLSTRDWLINAGMNEGAVDESCRQISRFLMREKAFRGTAQPRGYMGSGSRKAEVMVISDVPDECERNTKILGFSDYSIVLTIMMNKLGMEFEDIYWTTAIKDDTQRITFDKIQQHRHYLQNEILYVNPSVIISLGNTPLSALMNKKTKVGAVPDSKGYNVHDNLPDIPVIDLEHPGSWIFTDDFQSKFSKSWKRIKAAFQ